MTTLRRKTRKPGWLREEMALVNREVVQCPAWLRAEAGLLRRKTSNSSR